MRTVHHLSTVLSSTVAVATVLFLSAPPAAANPVPDHVGEYFNELVAMHATKKSIMWDDLVTNFGRFGLDLLKPEQKQAIRDEFDRFARALTEAQRPGHQLSHDIEVLFLTHADEKQQQAYVIALLQWLTEPIHEAPAEGSMRIEWSADELPRVIGRHRAHAAEMLADFGVTEAKPAMQALLESADLDAASRRLIERSLRRLADPCVSAFLRPVAGGGVAACITPDDIASITVDGVEIDPEQLATFVELFGEAVALENREGGCCSGAIVIELTDGTRGELLRSMKPGWFTVAEKGGVNYRRRWHIASNELWEWHESIKKANR